ncbi:MAG: hypothetical protein NVS3B21_24460 [Acidimicrobiales bacterium]
MFAPHHREHGQLQLICRPAEDLADRARLIVSQAKGTMEAVVHDLSLDGPDWRLILVAIFE